METNKVNYNTINYPSLTSFSSGKLIKAEAFDGVQGNEGRRLKREASKIQGEKKADKETSGCKRTLPKARLQEEKSLREPEHAKDKKDDSQGCKTLEVIEKVYLDLLE